MKYPSLEILTEHMKTKCIMKSSVFKCEECGKTFDKKRSFYSHRAIHRQAKKDKIICEACAKPFKTDYDLDTHMETVHRRVVRRDCTYKCTHCHESFNCHLDLLDHVREHQREKKEAPRLCEICARVCPNQRAYYTHLTIHKEKKPHNCTVSSDFFSIIFIKLI